MHLEDTFAVEEKLEDLREKLNKNIIKNIKCRTKDEDKNLLAISKELDDVIVSYIENSNK